MKRFWFSALLLCCACKDKTSAEQTNWVSPEIDLGAAMATGTDFDVTNGDSDWLIQLR